MKIVFLYYLKQLFDLIGLRLALYILKINQFRNFRMHQDVMAARNSIKLEPKTLGYCDRLGESDVFRS